MADNTTTPPSPPELYYHVPLPKHEGSIRLIQIDPNLSPDGHPDCTLQNANIQDSTYTCLSYVWGQPGDEHPIRLNGKLFHVRRNLYDSLHVARKRLNYCAIWIDALCINQADVEERNHQVQQMGKIFASAKMVVAWLGNSLTDIELIRIIEKKYNRRTWDVWKDYYQNEGNLRTRSGSPGQEDPVSDDAAIAHDNQSTRPFAFLEAKGYLPAYKERGVDWAFHGSPHPHIHSNQYWNRAWVTQEILLAKALIVVAGDEAIDFASFAHTCYYAIPPGYKSAVEEYADLMLAQKGFFLEDSPSGTVVVSPTWRSEGGLLALLNQFQGKCCALRRDRIYSLLALCKGGTDIKVDYNLSVSDLILQVLRACDEEICFCSAATVARIVVGRFPSRSGKEADMDPVQLKHDFKLKAYSLGSLECPSCGEHLSLSSRASRDLPGAVYFCLKSTSGACNKKHGHLIWESCPEDEAEMAMASRDLLLMTDRYRRSPRMLCNRGAGIDMTPCGSDGHYLVRFSLGALFDMMYVSYQTKTQTYSSHRCRRGLDEALVELR